MKLAVFADLHSNLEALRACLAHAHERGAENHAFVGDLVGYGADPVPVLEIVAAHLARGAIAVCGNHDAAAVDGNTDTMDAAAAIAIEHTRRLLGPPQRELLAALPLTVRHEGALFVHASADRPADWTYVSDPLRAGQSLDAAGGASWVFSGHVHVPALYYTGRSGRAHHFEPVPGVPVPVPPRRRWLAIAGAAGQPRDGNTAASYVLFDRARATLTWFRVPYDWRAAAARVRAAGLPEQLARRLEHGW